VEEYKFSTYDVNMDKEIFVVCFCLSVVSVGDSSLLLVVGCLLSYADCRMLLSVVVGFLVVGSLMLVVDFR
jgi:hypothetical protein